MEVAAGEGPKSVGIRDGGHEQRFLCGPRTHTVHLSRFDLKNTFSNQIVEDVLLLSAQEHQGLADVSLLRGTEEKQCA